VADGIGSEDKSLRPPGQVVRRFSFQHVETDCEVAQCFNILHELSDRLAVPGLRIPYDELIAAILPNAAAPVQPGPAKWLPKVQRKLPQAFRIRARSDVDRARWPLVQAVLRNPDTSYPIIGVSSEYWAQVTTKGDNYRGLDHDLILMQSDRITSVVFDSFASKLAGRGIFKARAKKGSSTPARGVIQIPTPRLVTLWEQAKTGKYVIWIERAAGGGTQLDLDREWKS